MISYYWAVKVIHHRYKTFIRCITANFFPNLWFVFRFIIGIFWRWKKFWNQVVSVLQICCFSKLFWLLGHVYFHVNFNTNLSTSTLKKSLVEFDQNWDEFIDQFGRTVLLKSTVFSNLFAIATSLNLFRL